MQINKFNDRSCYINYEAAPNRFGTDPFNPFENKGSAPLGQTDFCQTTTMTGCGIPVMPIFDTPTHSQQDVLAGHLQELNQLVFDKKEALLSKEDKHKVLDVLNQSKADGTLPELAKTLDNSGKLQTLYNQMGSLAYRHPGASAFLMLFTVGFSLGAEVQDNKAVDMKEILEAGQVDKAILDKLK